MNRAPATCLTMPESRARPAAGTNSGQPDEGLTSKCQTLNCLTYLALSAQGHAQEE